MNGASNLMEGTPENPLAPSTMGRLNEKTVICEPGNGTSADVESAPTLTLDFQPQDLRNEFTPFVSTPIYGILT